MSEKLYEFDKIEWRDIVRKLRPDWTDERFEKVWSEFIEAKLRKSEH